MITTISISERLFFFFLWSNKKCEADEVAGYPHILSPHCHDILLTWTHSLKKVSVDMEEKVFNLFYFFISFPCALLLGNGHHVALGTPTGPLPRSEIGVQRQVFKIDASPPQTSLRVPCPRGEKSHGRSGHWWGCPYWGTKPYYYYCFLQKKSMMKWLMRASYFLQHFPFTFCPNVAGNCCSSKCAMKPRQVYECSRRNHF